MKVRAATYEVHRQMTPGLSSMGVGSMSVARPSGPRTVHRSRNKIERPIWPRALVPAAPEFILEHSETDTCHHLPRIKRC